MEILNIERPEDHRKILELCKNLLEKHALIPVVGSGFSFDTPTDNGGTVPSVRHLHAKLFSYIRKYSGYTADELEGINKRNLFDLAQTFWTIYNRIPSEALHSFFEYVHTNFQDISYHKDFQKAFLKVQWPYLFTLNYDSLIEDYSNHVYNPVIPYVSVNRNFSGGKTRVYKLHGDAKTFTDSGDQRFFILSKAQYLETLMSDENEDMRTELLTAFSSKSILFFGCGLSEELDLLYSSQLAIREKVKHIDPHQQAIIYISYESDENASSSNFSVKKEDDLTPYGVTHVLRIFSEKESASFFNELADFSAKIQRPTVDKFLQKYSSMQFNILQAEDTACRDFLFQENLVWRSIEKHMITLPGYYVTRSKISKAEEIISNGEPLLFISGNFFSGKTFFLIELAQIFMTKKVYIFPSGTKLSNRQLDSLILKPNAIFCFDSKTLTTAQIKTICEEKKLDQIRKSNSSAIVVIDASDAPMYEYIFEARHVSREFPEIKISSIFNDQEEPSFNQKIGAISLPPYKKKETILDYIVENEKILVGDTRTSHYFLSPQNDLLAKNPKRRTKALIMLATEIRIPAKRAIQFEIDAAVNELIKCCNDSNSAAVIEKDYSIFDGNSSGFEFVCNSKYWVIRVLSIFASLDRANINVISDAYLSIINNYRTIYKDSDVKFYQNSEPYYFFDHIQTIFNYRWFPNSHALTNAIYEKLLPALANSFQFLHQKAKGKLEIARVQTNHKHLRSARKTLEDALFNITRAIQLAESYPSAKNIEDTILHMTYTKGRILIEFSCISHRYVPQTVETCYELYEKQKNIRHDAYDFTTGTGGDKKSFDRFKNLLISNSFIRNFEDLDRQKMRFLLTRWTGKNFSIRREKKRRKN